MKHAEEFHPKPSSCVHHHPDHIEFITTGIKKELEKGNEGMNKADENY
jgi:hypothetical protein